MGLADHARAAADAERGRTDEHHLAEDPGAEQQALAEAMRQEGLAAHHDAAPQPRQTTLPPAAPRSLPLTASRPARRRR
ncbi:hypothetical protein [Actinomadura kijaniata]|uniref:hypothetical protein n=1 Tax=Actinomadura kijaniata TaxID=46161 RepID=UPI00082DD4C7|nr:hypothetical protein [Actinomadura kijaniata]